MQNAVDDMMNRKPISQGKVKGSDVLQFSSHQQINSFVMFQVYQDWNAHMHKIAHPYFDFEHTEVRNALNNFLNKLSQHISISESDFRGLLETAVFNTIRLIVTPKDLLAKFFFGNADQIPIEIFNKHARYFSDFGFAVQAIRDHYEKNLARQVSKEDFLKKFDKVIELYEKRSEKKIKNYQKKTFAAAFNAELTEVVKEAKEEKQNPPATRVPNYQPPVKKEVKEPVAEPVVEPVKEPVNEPVKEPVNEPVPPLMDDDPEEKPIDLFESNEKEEEEEKKTLADTFRVEKSNSTSHLVGKDKNGGGPIEIPVHKQFQFVQKIFAGSSVKYKVVLEKIEGCSDAGSAQEVLDKYVLNAEDVNPEAEIVQEFVELIRNRF